MTQQPEPITVILTGGVTCPTCGAEECYPDPTSPSGRRFNIRAYRVCMDDGLWYSECLVCKAAGREAWFA